MKAPPGMVSPAEVLERTKLRPFRAERIGFFVTELSSEAVVTSVYEKAVNILLAEGLLLSIVANLDQMSALSIQVPALFKVESNFPGRHSVHPREGARVLLQKKCLIMDDTIIDLNMATLWQGDLSHQNIEAFRPDRIRLLERILSARGKEGGLLEIIASGPAGNVYGQRARVALRSVFTTESPPVLCGLAPLVGLGPGFTPSGDDFLSGVLLGEKILLTAKQQAVKTAEGWELTRECRVEKSEIEARLEKTSPGGRTLLWQALRGRFPCYLTEAARGISGARSAEQMQKAVECAVDHGETSGTDALAGLLWYFKYTFDFFKIPL